MAHMTHQENGLGNTNQAPKKSRNWCFTLNNYTVEELTQITQRFRNEKYLFQEEVGEQKTPHLQGVIGFKNARSFNSVKKLIPRAHIEVCRSFAASVLYCSKEDTRVGTIYSNFDYSKYTKKVEHKKKKWEPTKENIQKEIQEMLVWIDEDMKKNPNPIVEKMFANMVKMSVMKGKREQEEDN